MIKSFNPNIIFLDPPYEIDKFVEKIPQNWGFSEEFFCRVVPLYASVELCKVLHGGLYTSVKIRLGMLAEKSEKVLGPPELYRTCPSLFSGFFSRQNGGGHDLQFQTPPWRGGARPRGRAPRSSRSSSARPRPGSPHACCRRPPPPLPPRPRGETRGSPPPRPPARTGPSRGRSSKS